jgi:hypothetical protein
MRFMPESDAPIISGGEFNQRLASIAGRPLTPEEQSRADEMAAHGWLLRVVASELFGEAMVDAYFSPK